MAPDPTVVEEEVACPLDRTGEGSREGFVPIEVRLAHFTGDRPLVLGCATFVAMVGLHVGIQALLGFPAVESLDPTGGTERLPAAHRAVLAVSLALAFGVATSRVVARMNLRDQDGPAGAVRRHSSSATRFRSRYERPGAGPADCSIPHRWTCCGSRTSRPPAGRHCAARSSG